VSKFSETGGKRIVEVSVDGTYLGDDFAFLCGE
jgi:hypothetical protein